MNERTRTLRESTGAAGGLSSLFDEPVELAGHATVTSGLLAELLPVAGMTVGQVRQRFSSRFDIAPASQAEINGQNVDDETVLQQGEVLAFTHRAGEKGMRSAECRFDTLSHCSHVTNWIATLRS